MDELIADFLTETKEGLDTLDNELVELEQDPENENLLGSIFRIMHTIKGTCGFLGLVRLESVAHAGENIMDKIRGGELKATPDKISMVLEAIDAIKHIVGHLEENGVEPEGDDSELNARINAVANGESIASSNELANEPVAEELAAEAPAKPDSEMTEEEINKAAGFEPVPASATGVAAEAPAKPDSEMTEEEVNKAAGFEPVSASETGKGIEIANVNNAKEEVIKKAVTEGLKVAKEVEDAHEAGKKVDKPAVASQSVRVNVDVLESLMQAVSELVLNRNQLLQINRNIKDSKFTAPVQRLSHITSELQDRVMKTRMQPISTAWTKFPRLIRDLSKDLGKKIELKMVGADTELDRQLIESIKDPLTHMVRNSVDHGIELPADRAAIGKSETGTVTLKAYHQGGHILIEINDDGRGINVEKIKAKIIEKGLSTKDEIESASDKQILQYIFKAGFSTAEQITSVSGRGVGMDVVKTNIERISGTVELSSDEGKGSKFSIKIPLTLAIMPILIVEAANEKFGIPQINVIEMVRVGGASEYQLEEINGKEILRLRGTLLPLVSLKEMLKLEDKISESELLNVTKEQSNGEGAKLERCVESEAVPSQSDVDKENISTNIQEVEEITPEMKVATKVDRRFIVICEVSGNHFGVTVDRIYDTEEIVVKPVAPVLKNLGIYSGNTLLGNGDVILILDPVGLAKYIGELDVPKGNDKIGDSDSAKESAVSNFLIMRDKGTSTKAVPLELVSRLEEINVDQIEYSRGKPLVQYRESFMHLIKLDPEYQIPPEGLQQIVVFASSDKIMGLVVEEILDIVEQSMEASASFDADGSIGAMVIDGKTTDLVDISKLFAEVFGRDVGVDTKEEIGCSNTHILLVDDSPFFRKFIPPTLVEGGYKVTTVESAKKARSLLEDSSQFDLVITDINMPEMTGIELAQICMNDERLSKTPIIALTSNTDAINEGKNLESTGISAYVAKTNHDDILKIISEVLTKKEVA
jgi:two-component system, chemotaxis family, sensor kinase CheA